MSKSPEPSPIFVFGTVRSGTTVFRLMLDAHEEIANPGEVDFIFDYLEPNHTTADWTYDLEALRLNRGFQSFELDLPRSANGRDLALDLVGQMRRRTRGRFSLNVHGNLDKIISIFPEAKIIHIVRDPRDVARSCIGMGWAGNTYYGVDQWIRVESSWDQLSSRLAKEQFMELHYEDLILTPEQQLREVCRFIGVAFSHEMLTYPSRSTYQAPDPSAVQQWRNKMDPREVALIELKVAPLLTARNYELSGHPLTPPGILEGAHLFLTNKLYKWQFAGRHFGYYNVIMEKLTRRFSKSQHELFVQRMNELAKQYIK